MNYKNDLIGLEESLAQAERELAIHNTSISFRDEAGEAPANRSPHLLKKVLVANRGEIAKRFFMSLHEQSIPSVAVVTDTDKGQSWYEFADEVIFIGDRYNYTNIPMILAAAKMSYANALYTGYGFLSENPEFVRVLELASLYCGYDIICMGPTFQAMQLMGDKINARNLAREYGIPLFESSEAFPGPEVDRARLDAARIGYPVIVKLSAGGGGKGMYIVRSEQELAGAVESCNRIGLELYNNGTFYIEKFIQHPIHLEVQVFNGHAIGIRKCAVQRRNQKIIEESGHSFLDEFTSLSLLAAAEKIAHVSGYSEGCGAGTVEFLVDNDTGKFGFMEMNTRLQVEYAVTDQSLSIDLVKMQIMHFDGRGQEIRGLDTLKYKISERNHSIECRIYAEDPENDYLPSPGTIIDITLPTFNGIRCDFGFMKGDRIVPEYDPMIGKLIAHGATREEALIRMERALQELYIKGIKTNIFQLLTIVRHPAFRNRHYTNNLLADHPELQFQQRTDAGAAPGTRIGQTPAIFGAFTEYIRHQALLLHDFITIAQVEGIRDAGYDIAIPHTFCVTLKESTVIIDFIQVSIDTFHVYVDKAYDRSISLVACNERVDEFLILCGKKSSRVRVDRYSGYSILHMRDENNKVHYYRMQIAPEGENAGEHAGLVRSPFQGTFVAFGREQLRVGDTVEAGEPLVILSSMKMETTISAPCSGIIAAIIEQGDLSRLQVSRTLDGRIIGKSIQEGDLLVEIRSESQGAAAATQEQAAADEFASTTPQDILFHLAAAEQEITEAPERYIDFLLKMLLASVQGYITHPLILSSLVATLARIPSDTCKFLLNRDRGALINSIILHYTNVVRLFSPVVTEEGTSFSEQLDHLLKNREKPEIRLSGQFGKIVSDLLTAYGFSVNQWKGIAKSQMKRLQVQQIFFLVKSAYRFYLDHGRTLEKKIGVITYLDPSVGSTKTALQHLYAYTQTEHDDSAYKLLKKIFRKNSDLSKLVNSRGRSAAERFSDLPEPAAGELHEKPWSPPVRQEKTIVPEFLPDWITHSLAKKVDRLGTRHGVELVAFKYSGEAVSLAYRLTSAASAPGCRYVGFSFVDLASLPKGECRQPVHAALIQAAELLCHLGHDGGTDNWIELAIQGKEIVWDAHEQDEAFFCYNDIRLLCEPAGHYMHDGFISMGIIDAMVCNRAGDRRAPRQIAFTARKDILYFDILAGGDERNPYFETAEGNRQNQSLFDLGKWPVELWGAECFDPDTLREIRIPSLDDAAPDTPVGSKILTGRINGRTACFYMKDYRIRGGSTGDREGLKYCAAAYLAWRNGWPLYVFNDSAGANIKEGVISLNRGAEGFMMNSLIAERCDPETFERYIRNVPDPALRKLFNELDTGLLAGSPDRDDTGAPRPGTIIIAVGIGASAGLDVYGSSQANIQLILDSEHSYRVLTGSQVTRSVMGENITNYEIGGANVLGKWAGVVDVIAKDKIEMIVYLRKIHDLFSGTATSGAIQRHPLRQAIPASGDSPVLHESIIRNNVDHGAFLELRKNYYGSNELISGFARLGGSRVLLMGPRSLAGMRSTPSAIKAAELLRIAYNTDSHQVLIFGKKFQQTPNSHENLALRPHLDLMDALRKRRGIRVHVVTNITGLKQFEIHSTADAVIMVMEKNASEYDTRFAGMNATFTVDSVDEAFNRAAAIISALSGPGAARSSRGVPAIPADKSQPYNIIESVISAAFDADSFIEFYREMRNPATGASVITGIARLDGTCVGIIADQPLLQGGGADSLGTEKFRIFTGFCNRHRLPIIMLSNSSGFVPGSNQERLRIQAIGARSLHENILGEVPVVSVILNQNYGGRLIQAFNKFLRPGIVYIAHENATMAVLGSSAAFDLLHEKKYAELVREGLHDEAGRLRSDFMGRYAEKALAKNDALRTGVLDWVFPDVGELREHLVRGLVLATESARKAFQS